MILAVLRIFFLLFIIFLKLNLQLCYGSDSFALFSMCLDICFIIMFYYKFSFHSRFHSHSHSHSWLDAMISFFSFFFLILFKLWSRRRGEAEEDKEVLTLFVSRKFLIRNSVSESIKRVIYDKKWFKRRSWDKLNFLFMMIFSLLY